MHPKLKPIAAAIAVVTFASSPSLAAEKATELEAIVVTASGITQQEAEATYATEIHSRKMIEKTSATTVYEYLSQNSSVNFAPYFGSLDTPQIDMRGFGTANGFSNVAITVDGRSLNAPDSVPVQLGAIPLDAIERIEISKGSGSVMYGDGATAGAINIVTRGFNGASLTSVLGSRGYTHNNLAAGIKNQFFDLAFFGETNGSDGSQTNQNSAHFGQKNSAMNNNQLLKGGINLNESLRLIGEVGHSEANTWFTNPITQAQFDHNPAIANYSDQSHQLINEDHWRLGAEYFVNPNLKVFVDTSDQGKRSEYQTYGYDYKSVQQNAGLTFSTDKLTVAAGYQTRSNERNQIKGYFPSNVTTKNSNAFYVQSNYRVTEDTSVTVGARAETVDYKYTDNTGSLSSSSPLTAFDFGVNHRLGTSMTGFVNYNQSYSAPNIDNFFAYDFTHHAQKFNSMIEPQKVQSLTVGLNDFGGNYKTKIAIFYSRLSNEIYYDAISSTNTNIDQSHKYGLELQSLWSVSDSLSFNVNYSYVRALIDHEIDPSGEDLSGKELPGVPRHTVIASMLYNATSKTSLNLSQLWRDQAYAGDDLTNSFAQRQGIQASTNVGIRHRLDKQFEVFAAAENLFAHKNGVWLVPKWYDPNNIYPLSWEPIYKIGVKASF